MRPVYIKNGLLIDCLHDAPMDNPGILIAEGKIDRIGVDEETEKQLNDSFEVIDAFGKTIMPGLIDCHSHMGCFSEWIEQTDIMPIEYNTLLAARDINAVLMAGFTTVRYMGSRGNIEVSVRDAVNRSIIKGPRLLVSGRYITCTGGLMDYYPSWIHSPTGLGLKVDGETEAIKAVRELIKTGVDFIKMEGSGATVSPYCPPEKPTLSYAEMKAVTSEAARHGKRVAIHAESLDSILDAARAGVNTIEHGIFLNEQSALLLKENGIFYVPTIGIIQSRYEKIGKEPMPDYMETRVNSIYKNNVNALKTAKACGVKIAAGTDTGVVIPPGKNAYELSCFVQHGFTPMEAIISATRTASEALGIEKETGTIEKNKNSDIIIVNGNPITQIRILQDNDNVKTIIKSGAIIKDIP